MEGNGRVVCITVLLMALLQTTVLQNLSLNVAEDIKKAHDNFLVLCTLHNSTEQNIELKWYNPNNELMVPSATVRIRASENTNKLILKDLAITDAGIYTCKATVNGKKLEASASLKIFRPLSFELCDEEQQPTIYTDAKIRCTASGDPSPKVEWLYKDNIIKTSKRYELVPDGLIIKNITEADNGRYVLEAEIVAKSSFDDKTILVKVVVPPKISQPPQVSKPVEGGELRLTCKATGNPNPKYRWYKDSKDLTDSRFEMDSLNGILKVQNVKKSDSGKYKCVAYNIGGEKSAVAEITVLVPPAVEVPKEKTGKEGEKVSIVCRGKGIPVPSLTWQKSNDAPFPIGRKFAGVLVEQTKLKPDTELILTISSLKAKDADNYTCIGENEAGKDVKRTYLTVQYKPIFVNTPKVAYNWMGNKANITCTAKSLPKSTITWQARGQEIMNGDTYRIFSSEGQEQMTSFLQVNVNPRNEKAVFTEYTCKAVNIISGEKIKITLKKAVVPKSPAKVNILDSTPTTMTLVIIPPENDGGIPVNQYHITYVGNEIEEIDVTVTEEEASDNKKVVLENLSPNSKYQIKVFAGNRVGLSTTSVDLSANTPDIRKPFDVLIKSAREGTYPTEYRVFWDRPRTGGADIVSYSVQYRMVYIKKKSTQDNWEVDDSRQNGDFMTQTVKGKTSTVIANLKSNTYYELQVIANNKVGSSNARPMIFLTKRSPDGIEDPDTTPVDTASVPKTNVYKATTKEKMLTTEQATTLIMDMGKPILASTASFTCNSHLLMAVNAALYCLLALL